MENWVYLIQSFNAPTCRLMMLDERCISASYCTVFLRIELHVISGFIGFFCRFRRWVGRLWVSRSWWCSSWLCSCCNDMETSRSSSAWCCLARCWPGTCVSSSSSFYPWTSARSVPPQVIAGLLDQFEARSLNVVLCVRSVYTDHLQAVQDRPGAEVCLHGHPVTDQSHNGKCDGYTYKKVRGKHVLGVQPRGWCRDFIRCLNWNFSFALIVRVFILSPE